MELIKLSHPHAFKKNDFPELAMALGYFDGVHLGHQQVIRQAQKVAEDKGFKSAVMTFDPHPSVVLGKSIQHVEYITPLEEKMRIIENMNIDYLFVVQFSHAFSALLPQEFIDDYIIGLNVKHVIAGFDYTYGKMGKGTMETIQFHSRGQFEFSVVSKLATVSEEKISSTMIRYYLRQGKIEELQELLGRNYTTEGIVIHGDKRGRTIGFPTANIHINEEYILPPVGVYAVKVKIGDKWNDGVCNIGYKPTFKQETSVKPTVEVHIFDFDKDIYGEIVTIEWHMRIRNEQRFNGIEQLVAQIEKDKKAAMKYLEKIKA